MKVGTKSKYKPNHSHWSWTKPSKIRRNQEEKRKMESEMGENKRPKVSVVLFPLPFQGHINPMLNLAQIFYSKAFSITIIHTHFNSLTPSTSNHHPNFTFRSIDDGLSEAEIGTAGVVELITLLNSRCIEPFRQCVAELAAAGDQIGCLITDAHWHFTQGVADDLQIRRIVVRTGNISAFLAMVAVPDLRRNAVVTSSGSLSHNLISLVLS